MRLDLGYIAILASSFVVGAIVRRHVAQPTPLNRIQRVALMLGAFIGGALGAKLPYVLSDPEGAVSGMAWLNDGRTLTWGLVGGYFGVEFAKLVTLVRGKTGDGFAVPLAVSVGLGRLGCFYAGCCFGQPTSLPWGVDFGDGVHRHPNQLYEVAFHLLMAGLLHQLARQGRLEHQRIKLYILAYMGFRLVSETWRPEPRMALGLTFYQWSALAFGLLFVGLWIIDARRLRDTD